MIIAGLTRPLVSEADLSAELNAVLLRVSSDQINNRGEDVEVGVEEKPLTPATHKSAQHSLSTAQL